jgi:GNAT superfamily N-acetyltransferase
MTPLDWRERPISPRHDRAAFDSGSPPLDRFLKEFARQSHERGGAKTFVATDAAEIAVFGYYTISPADLDHARVPDALSRGLGRYPVGGFRLARLAVDTRHQDAKLGTQLLMAAGQRCLRASAEIGGTILIVDAKDERAAGWYARFGALPLVDSGVRGLVFPLATFGRALGD